MALNPSSYLFRGFGFRGPTRVRALSTALVLLALTAASTAFAQQPGPSSGPPAAPPNAQQPTAGPGSQAPSPGYPPPDAPPPGQPAYAPPPVYGVPAGASAVYVYVAPPPPKPREYKFSARFNPIGLVFGTANLELEGSPGSFVSFSVAPEYVFGDIYYKSVGIDLNGAGVQFGVAAWLEGRALRGNYLKLVFDHRTTTAISNGNGVELGRVSVPYNLLGLMFGEQSVYGGWFVLSYGFGIGYDMSSEEHAIPCPPSVGVGICTIPKTGPLENGWDIITQLAIGVVF